MSRACCKIGMRGTGRAVFRKCGTRLAGSSAGQSKDEPEELYVGGPAQEPNIKDCCRSKLTKNYSKMGPKRTSKDHSV